MAFGTGASAMARRTKYANEVVDVGGLRFDSKREARRWGELQLLERVGHIADLRRQVRFRLEVNGAHICDYLADFTYSESGAMVVEDAKGVRTRDYSIKAKLMRACHGITVREV
jgi:hypothetical protein